MLAVRVEAPAEVIAALERLAVALRDPRAQAAVLGEAHHERTALLGGFGRPVG